MNTISDVKVSVASLTKARILYDTVNEMIHYFLPKSNSSMGREWVTWCVSNGFTDNGRYILTLLYFWWTTLHSIWQQTDEASKIRWRGTYYRFGRKSLVLRYSCSAIAEIDTHPGAEVNNTEKGWLSRGSQERAILTGFISMKRRNAFGVLAYMDKD